MKWIDIEFVQLCRVAVVAVTLFIVLAMPVFAFRLPDSDQRRCYEPVAPYAEIPCKGTGQDGEHAMNPLSYTDNGDGTLTDNNTRLVWQKEDDGLTYNWYQATGTYDVFFNPDGIDICRTFGRLPSKKELIGIVDAAIPYPGPTVHSLFTNAKAAGYWSSTPYVGNPAYAWYVHYNIGSAYTYYRYELFSVRCVRDL